MAHCEPRRDVAAGADGGRARAISQPRRRSVAGRPRELEGSLGYTLLGVEDPDNRLAAWLEQTLRLYDDATLRKSLTQKYGVEISKLPKAQSRKGPTRLPESRVYEVAVPAALYAEALDKPGVDPAKLGGPIPLFFMLFREGQRTWLGFSSYAPLLEERLTSLLTPVGAAATLESKEGLSGCAVSPRTSAASGRWRACSPGRHSDKTSSRGYCPASAGARCPSWGALTVAAPDRAARSRCTCRRRCSETSRRP